MNEVMTVLGVLAILIISVIIIVIFVTRDDGKGTVIRNSYGLGTIIHLKATGKGAEKAITEAITKINDIDDKMSAFKESSEIKRINAKAGSSYEIVSKDTYDVIEKAVRYSEVLEGTFDPTIRPLVELWNSSGKQKKVPEKNKIKEKIQLVNYKDIILDKTNFSVKLRKYDQQLDLGGIAKGYAADEVRNIFKKYKVKSGLIDLGGNIYVLGNKENGSPWTVGIQDPFKPRGNYVMTINVADKSVVTSGDYEKYFIAEGDKYHHILDVRTGFPAESEIVSSTVISDNSIDGDGLSTGLFILGVEKSLKILEAVDGIDGIFITKDKKIYATEGIKKLLTITNEEFKLETI
ncbi:FAD:protein FMN transferase [Clostridium folliculivorans]|uniref:FAD:protein FMN transferase n=1 Tax=Clostridium folliculivorans TaxID=2886038 RepID=A0A9W5Y3V1_9CLOT|nr:FAD:protein FMN transferase [Clostridium folliculivorans]GKU26229.1 FAD:protein FMN transferase [Clostridium folliculivorans]GKU31901.1 FAD:protein FMN transferase [Clostridium folliculivorans]